MTEAEERLERTYKRIDRRGVLERAKAAYEKAKKELY